MRTRRTTADHQEAASRRLAELSAQLAAARAPTEAPPGHAPAVGGDEWWAEHTRVVEARPALALVPEPEVASTPVAAPVPPPPRAVPPAPAPPEPTTFVEPGRHAARRVRPSRWSALLPETLRGGAGIGAGHVAVVAVLVALGLAVTTWVVLRSEPETTVAAPPVGAPADDLLEVSGPAPDAGADMEPVAPTAPGAVSPAQPVAEGTVTVDVAGKVRRPGIVVLDSGARVVDALEQAGGARPGVDLTALNLARVLVDGEQILVGLPGAGAPPPPGTAPVEGAPAALVDLNLATQAELETLPDVGPVTATAIIAWRDEHGGFTAVAELLEVDGIGDATLERLTPLVTV